MFRYPQARETEGEKSQDLRTVGRWRLGEEKREERWWIGPFGDILCLCLHSRSLWQEIERRWTSCRRTALRPLAVDIVYNKWAFVEIYTRSLFTPASRLWELWSTDEGGGAWRRRKVAKKTCFNIVFSPAKLKTNRFFKKKKKKNHRSSFDVQCCKLYLSVAMLGRGGIICFSSFN